LPIGERCNGKPVFMTATPATADYQVKFETLNLGGLDYRIRSLLDKQQYSDPDGSAERAGISSAAWPLFGLVWPSSRILAGAMQDFAIEGKRILEIGCGLGLASMVMRLRGADITASDCHPLAAAFLAENLRLNQMAPIPFQTGNWSDHDPELGEFDVIIGSDVLYERDQPGILSSFIERHSNPEVEVIIVDPDRGNRAKFNRSMADLGYAHSEQRVAGQQTLGEPYKGRILNYRRGEHQKKQ
jgi:2-polyprenyl-3-methyl-5-hydroxy-6-metoxy-1,4-benzoquinol methylase